jgi:hypothetical protein
VVVVGGGGGGCKLLPSHYILQVLKRDTIECSLDVMTSTSSWTNPRCRR